jgi:hypothetical protein
LDHSTKAAIEISPPFPVTMISSCKTLAEPAGEEIGEPDAQRLEHQIFRVQAGTLLKGWRMNWAEY